MEDEVKKLMAEQYAKLPPELQKAIQASGLHDQITAIGTKNQLHIDQMGLLEDEVTMLMMGFTEPIEFAGVLQEHVHVTAEQAQKIATDVNQEILLPIRDRMENGTGGTPVAEEPKKPLAVTNPPPVMDAKSVVMPSAVAPAPASVVKQTASPVTPAPAAAAKPLSTDMQIDAPHEAEVMFTEPTVSLPTKVEAPASVAPVIPPSAIGQADSTSSPQATPATQAKPPSPPPIHKTDPYREPIE